MKNLFSFYLFLISTSVLFSQQSEERKSTASANVSIIEKEFVIPNLNTVSHKIWVYLPPNYQNSSEKYPVIYMHDAQNLFDDKTSYAGEWELDETLNQLYEDSNKGFIVVGIENGGEERINEYTPWVHTKYGGGKGAIYMDFIVNTLKPYIDETYRTKWQKRHTGLIGSSLGGLISYYGGLQYPEVFGKIGALSTSFWFSNEVVNFTNEKGNLKRTELFLLVGEKEGEEMVEGTKKVETQLQQLGFNLNRLKIKINPEGNHNETFWKNEFLDVVVWLYDVR